MLPELDYWNEFCMNTGLNAWEHDIPSLLIIWLECISRNCTIYWAIILLILKMVGLWWHCHRIHSNLIGNGNQLASRKKRNARREAAVEKFIINSFKIFTSRGRRWRVWTTYTHTWAKPPTHSRLIRPKAKWNKRMNVQNMQKETTTSSTPSSPSSCWFLVLLLFSSSISFIMNIKNYNLDWNKAQRAHSRIGNLMKSRALI